MDRRPGKMQDVRERVVERRAGEETINKKEEDIANARGVGC